MKKFMKWLKELFKQKPKPKPPQPDPQPQPEPNAPEYVHTAAGTAKWTDLKETGKILQFTFDASGFWSHNEKNPAWPAVDQYGKDGFICLVFKPEGEGKWLCYYWDCALNFDYKYVSLKHITDPQSPFAGRVKKGMMVGNLFVRYDNRERTNIVWGEWPI